MNRPPRKQKLVAEINITPFTDVILVLLIIFMITTPLISQTNLKVNLPTAKSGTQPEAAKASKAEITISREGPVYLNGKVVNKKELKEEIRAMHNNNPELSVTVRSDKSVKFQDIVNVLDPLTELGINKLNIAATAQD